MNKPRNYRIRWFLGSTSAVAILLGLVFYLERPNINNHPDAHSSSENRMVVLKPKETVITMDYSDKESSVYKPKAKTTVPQAKKEDEMTKALKLMEKEDYVNAASAFLAIIKDEPKNSDAHAWLAACYGSIIEEVGMFKKMKYNDLMEESINEALRLDPESTLAHMIRGRRYLSAPSGFGGDVKKAIKDFEFCIKNGRDDADIYYYLGQGYEKLGDDTEALKAYKKALLKDSKHEKSKLRVTALQK